MRFCDILKIKKEKKIIKMLLNNPTNKALTFMFVSN